MADFTKQVPPEILTEIFKWLHVSSLESFGSAPVDGGRIFELCWPVSSVCKYWREVALVSPFLWTYLPRITVRDDYENPLSKEDTDPFLATLKELISRAPNATLHPSFVCTATAIEGPHMSDVTTYLNSRCSEWGSVSISGVVDSIALFFSEIDIPCLLEALRLEFLEGDEEPDDTVLFMFEDAPMLKSLHISGAHDWNLELDTRSLVYLYDGVGGIIHNIATSDGFPQLTTLEIHDHRFFDFTDLVEDDFTLVLPALKKLVYMCDENMSSDEGFLCLPVAPLLEEVLIYASEGDVIANLVWMCTRSEGTLPLNSLRILKNPAEECFGELADLLRCLPDLEMLEMAFPSEDDIDLLAVSKGGAILVPRLKKCSFEYHADNFDGLNVPVKKLIAARCEPSAKKKKSAGEGLATMELTVSNSLSSFRPTDRMMPGFGDGQYGYLGIQPTRLEPWYGHRKVRRGAYTYAAHTIPQMLFQISHSQIDVNSFNFKHSLELITNVEQAYKANDLVKFLEANTNICMISAAYAFKTRLPDNTKDKNAIYKRVLCLLTKVKGDLMRRLDRFHWIWETSLDKVWIRYIPNDHELRSDPDKFANAVMLWVSVMTCGFSKTCRL